MAITALEEETRVTHLYSHFAQYGDDPTPAGALSKELRSFGGDDLRVIFIDYSAIIDDQMYYFSYDYQLDIYTQSDPQPVK